MKPFAAALSASTALALIPVSPAFGEASFVQPRQEKGMQAPQADSQEEGSVTVPLPRTSTQSDGEGTADPRDTQTDPNDGASDGIAIPLNAQGIPDINPYDRDLQLTVPLTFGSRSLGDIEMLMTADDRIFLKKDTFLDLVDTILNEEALAFLASRLSDISQFEPDYLNGTGIALTYDPATLAVVVVEVSAEQRAVVDLFAPPRDDAEQATMAPAGFSGYLNLGVIQSYFWEQQDAPRPTIAFDGALRLGPIVFEGDGQLSQQLALNGEEYVFQRNFARFVYDQPTEFRRWFLGDLDPEIRGQQSFVQMGGVGVLRQRRRFNGFRSAVLQANRELVLQREANVRFLRNGVLFREVRLQPGRYDFSQLPLIAGSNDVDIQIADLSGGIQNLSFQQYLDPIDLDPGDHEYGFYVGPTSRTFAGAPDYQGPVAVTGFYRKAFFDKPALGIGIQASEEVQNLTSQIQFVLNNSGRLLLDGGISTARDIGQGFAAAVSYEHFFDRASLSDSLAVRADYISPEYASLGNSEAINTNALSISAQYTRQFTQEFLVTGNASYIQTRQDIGDSYRIGATGFYRLNRRWTFRAGVDYAEFPTTTGRGSGINISAGIIFQPDFRRRAEARYESRNSLAELSYNQSGLNRLNSVGFGGILSRQDDAVLGQGFIGYAANRFDVQATHASFGPDISDFGATNITSVRVGTTIAFADDQIGIGRRINDSFMLLKAHPTLKERSVVAGQSLVNNNFISKSGALGSALNNFLGSYAMQSVQYDVQNPPLGYDTGPGIFRVFPSYKSGYAAEIGTDAFVTVLGTFLLTVAQTGSIASLLPEQPVSLAGGRVTLFDLKEGENPEPIPFFTNTAGRFAIGSLLPGRSYLVETYGPDGSAGYTFRFTVPQETDGLVNVGDVSPGTNWVQD